MNTFDRDRATKMPADNARFGATAAVTPLKVTCEHERKFLTERVVKAAADANPPARCLQALPMYVQSKRCIKLIQRVKIY